SGWPIWPAAASLILASRAALISGQLICPVPTSAAKAIESWRGRRDSRSVLRAVPSQPRYRELSALAALSQARFAWSAVSCVVNPQAIGAWLAAILFLGGRDLNPVWPTGCGRGARPWRESCTISTGLPPGMFFPVERDA